MKILNEVQGHSQLHGKFEASLGQGPVIKKKLDVPGPSVRHSIIKEADKHVCAQA